jgi:hypothetical protein
VDAVKSGQLIVEQLQLDFVARLADAWDGKGDHVFRASGAEHRALLALAGLQVPLAGARWAELHADERMKLVFAARQVIELGRECAWIFGEGQGARS